MKCARILYSHFLTLRKISTYNRIIIDIAVKRVDEFFTQLTHALYGCRYITFCFSILL